MEPVSKSLTVGFDPAWVVSGLFFIPYLVFGVYLLRLRLGEHQEVRPSIEVLILGILVVFYAFQYFLMRAWLGPTPLRFVLAVTALLISGAALYGHLVISLGSHLLVDVIMPSSSEPVHEPRYGAAEACERAGDFQGAVREYLAVSRMFPRDFKSALRAGDNLMKLDRPEEAASQFERALQLMASPEQSLPVAFRLVEIYAAHLGRSADARRVLESYLGKFPESARADTVRTRLDRLEKQTTAG